jgi:hypothetical protein
LRLAIDYADDFYGRGGFVAAFEWVVSYFLGEVGGAVVEPWRDCAGDWGGVGFVGGYFPFVAGVVFLDFGGVVGGFGGLAVVFSGEFDSGSAVELSTVGAWVVDGGWGGVGLGVAAGVRMENWEEVWPI